jgi:hypothetical protein
MSVPRRPNGRDLLSVSIAATVGAGFSEVVYLYLSIKYLAPLPGAGLHGPPAHGPIPSWLNLVAVAALMLLASLKFIDPVAEHLRALFRLSVSTHAAQRPVGRWLRPLAVGFVAMSTIYLHHVFAYMTEQHLWAVAVVLGITWLSIGIITYAWMHGARQQPPHAAMLGVLSAAGTEGVLIGIYGLLIHAFVRPVSVVEVLWSIFTGAVNMGIIGLAGGLAVDYGGGMRPSRRVAISIVAAAVVWTVIGWRVFSGDLKQSLSNVFLTGGWG